MRHSEKGLLNALERILRASKEPMDCVQLYDGHAEVREFAATPNRVSDYLGHMWRKGLLTRLPAASEGRTRTRWAYQWKNKSLPTVGENYTPHFVASRPNVIITEEGKTIHITLPNLVISIKQTKP